MKTLTCDNITIFKGGGITDKLLKNIGFSLMPGAILKINGRNGIGKSSFLKCIARLNCNNLGTIYYNKCNVDDHKYEYNSIISYISDKLQLNDRLTVEETLEYWAGLYGTELIIPSAIYMFDLEKYSPYKVSQLSRGWQKRLILSRLILQNTRIWLLDEPSTHLDSTGVELLYRLIETHSSNGGITIIADHIEMKKDMLQEATKYHYITIDLGSYKNV